ncbi:NADH-quinone oxidoreductase subunit J [Paenibacillus agilis]|uniref:NADH-quinone oxidoreductase subunit J n=1 Tax=Paenibacillus agilis TaxID=3020863 RepID=A0A559IPC9_9BACL|nr:NADH-quinone oxidoreductase subunit J [Paenibacillus agilis]TVX89488.1 NADH-quinone oxidoreductase subunit J [Paenibacillus agilis]
MFELNFVWNGHSILFLILAVCIISGAVFMLHFSKIIHMVVSLAFTFIGLAGVYVLLEAEFVATVQILVYAGAISILMIFGIMMTKHDQLEESPRIQWKGILAGVGCLALFGAIFFAIRSTSFPSIPAVGPLAEDNTLELGKQIFTAHVIPFELLSVLLTVAFIGAIVVAKHDAEEKEVAGSATREEAE